MSENMKWQKVISFHLVIEAAIGSFISGNHDVKSRRWRWSCTSGDTCNRQGNKLILRYSQLCTGGNSPSNQCTPLVLFLKLSFFLSNLWQHSTPSVNGKWKQAKPGIAKCARTSGWNGSNNWGLFQRHRARCHSWICVNKLPNKSHKAATTTTKTKAVSEKPFIYILFDGNHQRVWRLCQAVARCVCV